MNESILHSTTYLELKKKEQLNKKNNDKRLTDEYQVTHLLLKEIKTLEG